MADPVAPELIRQLALQGCVDVYGEAEACTEPCDACWQQAEQLLQERADGC